MVKCVDCGADTILYVNGVPVCRKCDQERDQKDQAQQKQLHPNPPSKGNGVRAVKTMTP